MPTRRRTERTTSGARPTRRPAGLTGLPRRGWGAWPRLGLSLLAAGLALGAAADSARADTVTLKSGRLERLVKIRDVKEGKLYYRPAAGRSLSRRLSEVQLIEVAKLEALNAAELDFDAGRFAEAARGYQAFLPQAARAWQKRWARYRLLCAYDELGEFSKAVEQYCVLVSSMPESVALLTPKNWPDPSSTFYTDALAFLERARQTPTTEAVAEALDRLDLRIQYKVKGQTSPTGAEPEDYSASESPDPPLEADTVDPEIAERLALIAEAYDRRAYAKTVELADAVLPEVGREQAARVLLYRGKALFNQARAEEDYFEAALSLMRVVIHLPDTAAAGEAGYYAALAMERTKHLSAAQQLLQEALPKADSDETLRRQIQLSLTRVAEKMGPSNRQRGG